MTERKFEYSKFLLVFGNLALVLWLVLATLAFWLSYGDLAWVFLLAASFVIYALLRRLGCSTCAYCKSCTTGFGRLSGWFFGKRQTKDFMNKTALAFVVFLYCFLGLFPAVILIISIFQTLEVASVIVLVCLLAVSLYSATTWFKTSSASKPATLAS